MFKIKSGIKRLHITRQNLAIVLLVLFLFSVFVTNTTYRKFKDNLLKKQIAKQEAILVGKRLALMSYFSTINDNVNYLSTAYTPDLKEYGKYLKQAIELNTNFYQIGFFDTLGNEKVKVSERYGSATVECPKYQQNQSHKNYFKKGMELAKGEMYFSHLHLNMENGEIEKPYRPTVKIFTPVFIGDIKIGLLCINLNALSFLDDLSREELILLNRERIVFSGFEQLYKKCSVDSAQIIYTEDNIEYHIKRIPFVFDNNISWSLTSRLNLTEFTQLTDTNRNRIFGISLIIFISIALLGYFYSLLETSNTALEMEKTLHDERKKSEQRYKVLSEELLEANELKELFLDIVSHDLKNPTGVILGMSDLLIDEDKNNEIYKQIYSSSKSLIETLNNITGLSRVIQQDEIEKENLDLSQILDNCVIEVDTLLLKSEMTVEKAYPPTFPIIANSVIIDIFRNFLSNAIKYASQGRTIIIKVIEDKGWVEVSVADFGVTIEGEDKERIFLRGKQLENGFKRGNGLGLSIVKKIAIAHSGEVGVRENTPRGNVFYYRFPKQQV